MATSSRDYRTKPAATGGMPPGIPFIVGNEAAERFSFYGMKSILVVFMTQHLLSSAGRPDFLTETESREWMHLFVASAYFFPVIGGILADAFLGKYLTILLLSLVYCAGHLCLALMDMPEPFLTATLEPRGWLLAGLALVAIGSGGIKPCVSAHVGDQFGHSNRHLLERVFGWFYFAINFGSFFSTLLTPWLLEHYGAGWAFGVPGILMAIATFVFWLGRHRFVHVPPRGPAYFSETFGPQGLRAIAALVPLYLLVAVFWSLYDQTGSSWVLQAEQMDLRFLGVTWLESQVQAVNPILVLVFIPLFTFVIYPWCNRIFSLTPLRKIGLGMILMTVSFALVTLIQTWIDAGERPSIGWQVAAFFIITAAEIMVAIVGMEFAYTQAPRTMKSWVMALFWLAVWGGNQFTAQVNHFIAIASPAEIQFEKATLGMPSDWENSPRTISLPGFDGVTGTADDFVARCKQGRMNSLEIPGREIFLDAANRIEAASQQHLPSNIVGNELLGGVKDPWENPLVYDVIDSSHARISSAGPDRTAKTQWDIGVMIEKTNGSNASADDTWLGRRKIALGIREQPTEAGFSRSEFSGGQSRLEGAAYFRFFTWLVLATTVIFIPFAYFYQPKTYLHD